MGSGAAVPSTSIGTNTIQKMRLRILPFVSAFMSLPNWIATTLELRL